jgi:hypothetical protein
MKVAAIFAPTAHFSLLMSEMARGVELTGDECIKTAVGHGPMDADAAICWGWRRASIIRRANPAMPVLVMERGYVGDRFHWTSLGWNGLNGRAIFPKRPAGSWRHMQNGFSVLHPWRPPLPGRDDRYALILGQVQGDQACKNVNLPYQYRQWYNYLTQRGHSVRFRPHPKALGQANGIQRASYTRGTLEEDLAGAKFSVSWNSNSSVDSVLQGVPSVTFDEGAMAWPVTSHELGNPVTMPSRTEWAAQLAWCQWQPSELADGSAWRAVKAVKP